MTLIAPIIFTPLSQLDASATCNHLVIYILMQYLCILHNDLLSVSVNLKWGCNKNFEQKQTI